MTMLQNQFKLTARISASLEQFLAKMENEPEKHIVPRPIIERVMIPSLKPWNETSVWVFELDRKFFPSPQNQPKQSEYFILSFSGKWPEFMTDNDVDRILECEGLQDATVDELFNLEPKEEITYIRDNRETDSFKHKRFKCWKSSSNGNRIGSVCANGRRHFLPCRILVKKEVQ